MARKRHLLQSALPTILKNFLLGLCCTLLILFSQGFNGSDLAASKQHQAQQLTQLGHAQLHQGQPTAALQTWEAAYQIYRQLHNASGVTGSLINQSLALQANGLYPRACQTLLLALELENWICTSPIQQVASDKQEQQLIQSLQKQPLLGVRIIGLRNLGDVLRLLGKPDTSDIVLQKAVAMAKNLTLETNVNNQLLLSLANTKRTLYNQAKNKYQLTDEAVAKQKALQAAQSQFRMALELYQKVATSKQNSTALQAQLNQLSLLLEPNVVGANTPEIKGLQSTSKQLLQTRVKQLLVAQFGQLPAIESVYARLNFAESLMQIAQNQEMTLLLFPEDKNSFLSALSLTQEALQLAHKLDNERAESYALGIIGKIYGHLGQLLNSKQYLKKALSLAQSVQAWDIAYQWQQQLGRVYQYIGNSDEAIEAYAGAISSLNQVQGSILSANPDMQFSFKDKIEPVYQEYIELLLAQEQPKLNQVVQTYEQLKLAELENFLQCGKLPIISLSNIKNSTAVPPTIYLINLFKRVEVIVRTKPGIFYRHTLTRELVSNTVENLLTILQNDRFVDIKEASFLIYCQSLYKEIFAPIKKYLPESGTLVFVPDSYFQNLPIAMLHDGKNYLLKSYNISIALSSSLWQPQALTHEQLRVLIAGISEISPSFKDPLAPKNLSPLPEVATEVANIKANAVSTVELLNAEFTSDHFRQRIEDHLPVTHITTHGQFSSDPEQTFILAWDRVINIRELNFLLRKQDAHSAIELLVLSACQTAKGDRRSALGIAGIATQAGARSTLATLWLVDAESTAQLMGEFYSCLKKGVSKAEALRRAQLTLLSNPKYSHPFYWASFVLIGSWL